MRRSPRASFRPGPDSRIIRLLPLPPDKTGALPARGDPSVPSPARGGLAATAAFAAFPAAAQLQLDVIGSVQAEWCAAAANDFPRVTAIISALTRKVPGSLSCP